MSRTECPEPNKPGCPYAESRRGCYSDTHHLLYPRADYQTSTEKKYRELPENKEQLCRYLHNITHATELPPEKPTLDQMRAALGQIAAEGAA